LDRCSTSHEQVASNAIDATINRTSIAKPNPRNAYGDGMSSQLASIHDALTVSWWARQNCRIAAAEKKKKT